MSKLAKISILALGIGLFACPVAVWSADSNGSFPVVAGFERFYEGDSDHDVAGGRLLIGELNCVACHRTGSPIHSKQAPILDNVAGRVRPKYLRGFIADPGTTKPGTTMPNLFDRDDPNTARDVEALVHFLMAQGGRLEERLPSSTFIRDGESVFHEVGCVACHQPRRDNQQQLPTSVPLGDLTAKYSVPSLQEFLKDPLKVRPSGRMPHVRLDDKKLAPLAHFLMKGLPVDANMTYTAYEGSWQELPNFDELQAKSTGNVSGLDLAAADRTANFAMRFEGFLHIEREGEYRFFLGSDDGSKLWIDDELVVDCDGIHAHQVKNGSHFLKPGPHRLRVDYMQGGGEWTLELQIKGPKLKRQPVSRFVSLTKKPPEMKIESIFEPNDQLVAQGRDLFVSKGCASCHQLKGVQKPDSKGGLLHQLDVAKGCLADQPPFTVPDFRLSDRQRKSLTAALGLPLTADVDAKQSIDHTLTAFNCYACHARSGKGGVERSRDDFFATTIKEMGDEGRIPPPLDGVGDKLNEAWMKHIFTTGADDRPYMLTNMPRFGEHNVGRLIEAFVQSDRLPEGKRPDFDIPEHRITSAGRFMVGDKAFSCIKCHYFDKYEATGIQAMNLTSMTTRLREEWFRRYVRNPNAYRPGTRMPASWPPKGPSLLYSVLNGDSEKQIQAVWDYLSQGSKARLPSGLIRNPIVLAAKTEAIVYRNFIEGAGTRAIGVGYPEKLNLAYDANNMTIALLWHGQFIDASRHWNGRGQGFQPPLGDHVIRLPQGPPLASLQSLSKPWPTSSAREAGFRFLGYRHKRGYHPVYKFRFDELTVTDDPSPVTTEKEPFVRRVISVVGEPVNNLWYRAAAGENIESLPAAGDKTTFRIDDAVTMRFDAAAKPIVRESQGKQELLVPVTLNGGKAAVAYEIIW